jgi:hypothetical protein
MGTFKTIVPSKENFELALAEGFTFLMTFESSSNVVVFNDLDLREEIINEYDYSNYDVNDHRYTVQPIDIDELEQFNYFQ